MSRFSRDTAVTRLSAGAYEARLDPGWWIVRGPNGGYVAALLQRAIEAEEPEPERTTRSLTVHFTAPPIEGPAEISVEVLRRGRSLTALEARIVQDGRLRAIALAALSKDREASEFHHVPMPEVLPPEQCEPMPGSAVSIPMRDRYESRIAIGGPMRGGDSEAVNGGWIRLAEGSSGYEPALLAAITDAWPPAIFQVLPRDEIQRGVPTVDLTVHFRSPYPAELAPDDFVLVRFQTRTAAHGFLEEDGWVWSRNGVLLAHSRQLGVLM